MAGTGAGEEPRRIEFVDKAQDNDENEANSTVEIIDLGHFEQTGMKGKEKKSNAEPVNVGIEKNVKE